ncbi:hypothetical protein MKUB_02830 [Mycobacterium kubicae]|uniref:Uncharacterized protein n=1 Tax=Mycobacterium kubicae TaxID=120959 RepID=A0AAX1JA89_9MYCO|nr:hypothetical protein [Mycobacterium kubicae]MCV7093649.1 hypothetical protein [Mycobacterium kubicae]OBF19305.1 hypothetical protein A5725_19530 [Mycobacterium kubicae]ORW00847.1 hypothetical protein AWC13_08710 [Mycobacterium kubicae]QNI05200.1 hypothetical protein GAN17_01920 [Mycobacterium kubicae]QNI10187.1 hypothetical protein GAN18_02195 [Mycobacterium kubicae]
METSVSTVLDAIAPEHRTVIIDELARRDSALLAQLRDAQEPTTQQREAVEHLLATAVIKSLGSDYTPNEHGLAVERAVKAFLEAWPIRE